MSKSALARPMKVLPIYVANKIVYYPGMVCGLEVIGKYWVGFFDKLIADGVKTLACGYATELGSLVVAPGNTYNVATECTIVDKDRISDTKYNLVLRFKGRLKWDSWKETTPYLVANFTNLADIGDPESLELKEWARLLEENAKSVFSALSGSEEFLEKLKNRPDVGAMADALVFHLTECNSEDYETAVGHLAAAKLETRALIAQKLLFRQVEKNRILFKTAETIQEESEAAQKAAMDQASVAQHQGFLLKQKQVIEAELAEIDRQKKQSNPVEADRGAPVAHIKSVEEKLADLAKAAEAAPDTPIAEAYKVAEKQSKRLEQMDNGSQEAQVTRTYLDLILDLPWATKTEDIEDIAYARKVLDEDHFGLQRIKKRILEYLAVRKISPGKKGPILCFIGPPGTGKTSIGKSIARAMGRRFIRQSLGGVGDEAEIRGHRRTYVGALPGRIIQGIKRAGVNNPVFMLDEIDKLKVNHGDPASALLEALDPEQNHTFSDHNLEIPFDLSGVVFLCTANFWTIPPALLDRMEIINLTGYTRNEKASIAEQFLVPKQLTEHGFAPGGIEFSPEIIGILVEGYTRESGVRNLEREIADVLRAIAVKKVEGAPFNTKVTPEDIVAYLGPHWYELELAGEEDSIGVSTGLYWSPTGGSIAIVETLAMPGRGRFILTGNLQEVIKESAIVATGYIRSRAKELGIDPKFFRKHDIHIHFPDGAMPKDGPSAGLAITTALVSLATERKISRLVAMTGEMDLLGRAMPIGGLKEKLLGAHRAGIKTVLFPEGNKKDLVEVPDEIKRALELVPVKHINDVLPRALI